MIDTVVLLIPPQDFKILKPSAFTPHTDLVYQNQVIKAVQNPAKQDLKIHGYLPRLTLSRRMNLQGRAEIMLTIECSAPKLLFGNNLEELQLKDFNLIVQILHEKLLAMNVEINPENLAQATILRVHFAKNTVLKDGSTPFHYIQKIKQCLAPSRLDHNQTNYRNSGHCFKWHCNSYEIVFYDKLFDMMQAKTSKKRTVDAHNAFDIKSLKKIRTKKKKFEVLRIEVRLNTRTILKKVFETLTIKNNLTLHAIFKPIIAKKVLLHYINIIERKRSHILDFKAKSDQALLSTLAVYNPHAKPKDILSCFAYKKLSETMTVDEIKKIIGKEQNKGWNKMLQLFDTFNIPATDKPFEIIRKQIEHYKALRMNI